MFKTLLALSALLLPVPASGQTIITREEFHRIEVRKQKQENWEIVRPFFVANTLIHVADAYTTHICVKRPNCRETNSLYGSDKPSLKTIVGIKGATILGSYLISKKVSEFSPAAGVTFLGVSGVVTGKYVLGNIKILW